MKLGEADFFPGVLDSATAEVLHAWIQKGLRHRGHALVLLKNNVWGQPPLVFAYWAWDALVRALGCPYGLGISNTWRPFSTTPGAGQTDASNHALGLAIDLACDFDEDYSDRTSSRDKNFPVAFEASWSRDPQRAERDLRAKKESLRRVEGRFTGGAPAPAETDAKVAEAQAAADAAKAAKATNAPQLQAQLKLLQDLKKARDAVADAQQKVDELLAVLEPWKLEYELRFRLYGHTTLDFLNLAPEQLVAALDRAFGTQQNDDGPRYGIVDDYRGRLVAMFPTTLSPAHAAMRDGIIAPYVETLRATVDHLLTLARQDGAFAAAYVRKTVRPFRSDAWSLDGGDSLPEIEAAKDAEDPKVVALNPQLRATAKAWLNLSRLGWHLGLGNISGRNKDFKRAWKHPLLEANRTLETIKIDGKMPPVEREPPKAPEPYDAYKDHSRRGALGRFAAAIRKIKAEVPDYVVTIKGQDGESEQPVKSFDDGMIALLESWPPREYELSDGLTIDAHGLDLVVQVSGESEKRGNQGANIAKLLSTGSAMVVSIGESVVSRLTTGATFTGEQIKTALENAELVPSKDAARGDTMASSRAKKSTLKTTADQTLRLRPVFAPAGVDLWQAKVIVPAAGTPKGLEWWHFEHRRRTGAWPSHMAEIGVSERVITALKQPESLDGIVVPGSEIKSERGNYPFPDEPSNDVPVVPEGG